MKLNQVRIIYLFSLINGITFTVSSCLKIAEKVCLDPTPVVITEPPSFITYESAILNGKVFSSGQKINIMFEFGSSDLYGQTLNYTNSINESGFSPVSFTVSGLEAGVVYHFRLKADGVCESAFGEDVSFKTPDFSTPIIPFNMKKTYGEVMDIHGNSYKTIKIGDQTWMAENLRAIFLNDGTGLSHITNNRFWVFSREPAFCWYNNSIFLKQITGNLYNWYAVSTGKLCPVGWHVPSDDDWKELISFLGDESIAAGMLKSEGTGLWFFPNSDATNESGFTSVPSGLRDGNFSYSGGTFDELGESAYYWTATSINSTTAKYKVIDWAGKLCGTESCPGRWTVNNKNFGFSVRCLKD